MIRYVAGGLSKSFVVIISLFVCFIGQRGICLAEVGQPASTRQMNHEGPAGKTDGETIDRTGSAVRNEQSSAGDIKEDRVGKNLIGISDTLVKITGALSLQVSILGFTIAFVALMIGGIIIGINSYLKKAVNDKMYDILDRRLNESSYESSRLHSMLNSAMFGAVQDICLSAKRKVVASSEGKSFSDLKEDDWNGLVTDLAEIILTPAKMISLINKIVASDKSTVGLRQDVYTLWAEVKVGAVQANNMRIMLSSMIEILIKSRPDSPALPYLKKFRSQLEELKSGKLKELPERPDF